MIGLPPRLPTILYIAVALPCVTTLPACSDAPADAAGSSESGSEGGGRCVAAADGRACRCGADVSEIEGWSEVPACADPPAAEPWTCCEATGTCACGVPRCLTFAGDRCLCAAFVETPADAMGEVESCSALICCDRGDDCECSGTVLTCAAADTVDECVPPQIGVCAENSAPAAACQAP